MVDIREAANAPGARAPLPSPHTCAIEKRTFMTFHIYLPVAGVAVNALAVIGVGGAVGFLSGLFGVGGGFIITPLMLFLVSGIIGSLLGTQLVGVLRARGQFDLFLSLSYVLLLGSLGTLMLIESLKTMRSAAKAGGTLLERRTHISVHRLPFKMRFPRSKLYMSVIPVLGIGAVIGILTALMGVGGGFALVPAMVYVLKMRTNLAVGTSLYQIMFVGAFTTMSQAMFLHSVDVVLGMLLISAGVIGTQLGAKAGANLKGEQLRFMLALLVLAVCLRVGFDLVRPPAELYLLSPVHAAP
jgi:uncharacterized membrane protein YfcA